MNTNIMEAKTVHTPGKIMQLMHSRWAIEALRTGVHFDLFSMLSQAERTADELARELKVPQPGLELLLNALVSLDFLEKDADKYRSLEISRTYLDRSSKLFIGSYILDDKIADTWTRLREAISSGRPINTVNQELKAEEFFPKLAASIFPMNYGIAHMLAGHLQLQSSLSETPRVLDVAAGSGVWSLALAERHSRLKVDALDFPAVLNVTREFAEKLGVAERYSYIEGNWSDCRLEPACYDIVCLGHILHSEGKKRSQELLKAAYQTLKDGGRLLIAEMISDNNRVAPPFAQLFALNMFLLTEDGCVFSESELKEMLESVGFKNVTRPQWTQLGPEPSPVMIAQK